MQRPVLPEAELAKFAGEMRANYRSKIPATGAPDPVAAVRGLPIPARLYVPLGAAGNALPMVLFAHGGGFVAGDLDTHDVLARAIANRSGALVIAVDYRLAPEHPFPAGLDDVYAALEWLAKEGGSIGGDPQRMAVCGDSAGANLVAGAAILARDRRGPGIGAQWLMYPALDNRMDTASWHAYGEKNFPTRAMNMKVLAAYVPCGMDANAPLLAPMWARHEGLPATLVQVGEHDPLRDEGVAYAQALKDAGVDARARVYKDQQHGFIQFFKDAEHFPEGAAARDEGCAFLRAHIG
ncbi:alpha/beta hydrolase [Pseudoduganella sp. R-43]|uniref:alpha/beta hydrolase n=1 Tax=unclassified Pseudoduganella TaxID=2637179 RepID=UPI003CF6F68F